MKLKKFERNTTVHPWHDVAPGDEVHAGCFNAVIEIPLGCSNKYELDKASGLLRLDRVLHSAVYYPANYGFIPQTLADDGDPLDVLVLAASAVVPLTIIAARAIGLMTMMDNNERDHKIIAVPIGDPEYSSYQNVDEIPAHRLAVLQRFFQDYKTLENKSVVVDEILPASKAPPIINRALIAYQRWKAGEDVIKLLES
jgi:inorganic pyrophosphatase